LKATPLLQLAATSLEMLGGAAAADDACAHTIVETLLMPAVISIKIAVCTGLRLGLKKVFVRMLLLSIELVVVEVRACWNVVLISHLPLLHP
jgi:hypothetical protein